MEAWKISFEERILKKRRKNIFDRTVPSKKILQKDDQKDDNK